jgi:exodeoxyribonuclease V beta subunit
MRRGLRMRNPSVLPRPLDPLELPCRGLSLIEASAGTGKTYTIATLYQRLLLEQRRSVREILVVTFTQAATEELRDRIRGRMREALAALQGAGTDDPVLGALLDRLSDPAEAAHHLQNELTCIDEASIHTIHGFCQRMLQENAFESGTLFDAELITNERELIIEAVEDFWRRTFYGDVGLAELAAAHWGTPAELARAIEGYLAKRDLKVLPQLEEGRHSAAAYREALARVRARWADSAAQVRDILHTDKGLSRAANAYKPEALDEAIAELEALLASDPPDYRLSPGFVLFTPEKLEESLKTALRKKGAEPPRHAFFEACQGLADVVRCKALQLQIDAIRDCREALAARKRERGVIAFDDLLTGLGDALHAEGGEALAERIARRYPVALIDEFQDTDPEQYRIFGTIYRARADCALFMIGDPKQAIYSFRGADVFTYMRAKEDTDPANERFTLDRNWRSASRLVDAINAVFACHAPFVYRGHIDFQAVKAQGKADEAPLRIDGCLPVPLQAWFVPRTEANTHQGCISKAWASEHLSAACAEEVVRLLALGAEGRARIGDRALAPRDIAVLVRSRFEAEAIQSALRRRGVASVFYSRDSVFASEEAAELQRLLGAIAAPEHEGAVRAGLCTGLWGMGAQQLDALLHDEIEWEALLEAMQHYHRLWLLHGFMAMFRRVLHEQSIATRLLGLQDGERRLTNLLQLAELLQNASREHQGIENLLRWLAEQIAGPDGDSEEQQLRLESDEALVKIVTIHKSKGLEYPVVLLPFLWGARRAEGPPLFHEETGARAAVLDLERAECHCALAEKERLAEDLRLAYVALTRAKYLCYFSWGHFRDAERSALAWLFHADEDVEDVEALAERCRSLSDEALRRPLEALAEKAPECLALAGLPEPTGAVYRAAVATGAPRAARTVQRRVRQDWAVASFTGLTSGRLEAAERPDYGSRGEDREEAATAAGAGIFQFPRGAHAGSFLHQLFESIDFPNAQGETLESEVRRQLARHGFPARWQSVIQQLVGEVLDAVLDAGTGLRLRDVTDARRLVELEFHYPIARLAPGPLNAALEGLGEYHAAGPKLRFEPVAGVMRGFIDLVFEHEGRFYLVDYKSSYLGVRLDDYAPQALAEAVARHRYDLQYLLYTVALHRYLRRRIPGYRYARHFGGVYYLFLRGMRAAHGAASGVHFARPEESLVETLDALFAGAGRPTASVGRMQGG